MSDYQVIPVDLEDDDLSRKITKLKNALEETKNLSNVQGVFAESMNKLGMKMADEVIRGLNCITGITAEICRSDTHNQQGYPRIVIYIDEDPRPFYLTPKTSNITSGGSARNFYLSSSKNFKVQANGFHLIA
ncbi:MAG: hypothetical protein ACTSVL_06330, partial [Promethearchaeota archaeon]